MDSLVWPINGGNALEGYRAVTVAVTHDIANDRFDFFLMSEADEFLAHAYILTIQEGDPMVYSESDFPGQPQWKDLHSRFGITQLVKFHNEVAFSDMEYLYTSDCAIVFRRGYKGLVGINKCGFAINIDLNMNNSRLWWYTRYNNLLNPGQSFSIESGNLNLTLDPRSAATWLIEE